MHLGGIPVWEKSGVVSKRVNFLQSGKITYMETFQNLLKSHLSFGESLECCNAEKRGCNRKKVFHSEMWENAVQRGGGGGEGGWLVKVTWDFACMRFIWKLLNTFA